MTKTIFVQAIKEMKLVTLRFKDSNNQIKVRSCVPFDYGPSRRYNDGKERYHFWDLDSPDGQHNLSLLPSAIISIVLTHNVFDPATFVTWAPTKWFIPRDWGKYS